MARGFLSALLFVALAVALSVALSGPGARSEPLDAATCGQLRGEQVRMEQSGVRASMEKGPQWAKANLAADKLDQIRRLMDVDEQLIFRCSSRNLVELPPEADADPAPPKTDKEDKEASSKADTPGPQAKPDTAKAAAPPPAKTPAAKPGPKKEAAKSPPETAKAAPTRKQEPAKSATPPSDKATAGKPWPKAKVEDAYKAPPPNPNVDPFANQPARQ
jgi:hypothetical protein